MVNNNFGFGNQTKKNSSLFQECGFPDICIISYKLTSEFEKFCE